MMRQKKKKSTRLRSQPIGKPFTHQISDNLLRYDLLSLEGLAYGFRCFLGIDTLPKWKISESKNYQKVFIKPEVKSSLIPDSRSASLCGMRSAQKHQLHYYKL